MLSVRGSGKKSLTITLGGWRFCWPQRLAELIDIGTSFAPRKLGFARDFCPRTE